LIRINKNKIKVIEGIIIDIRWIKSADGGEDYLRPSLKLESGRQLKNYLDAEKENIKLE